MSRRIVIVDSELSSFGRHEDHSGVTCAARVGARLLLRNPATADRVDLISVGAARMSQSEGLGNGLPQLIGERIGLAGVAGLEVHAFCASGNVAVHQAATNISAGRADVALVIGVEHRTARGVGGALVPEATAAEGAHGFSPPVFYALCADRYMRDTGATREALAQVAVNNRRHASTNPKARYREPISLDEVLGSRMISEPLTLLQCCPPADGAGALLLAAHDALGNAEHRLAVEVLGWGSASSDAFSVSLTSFAEDARAGAAAFGHAEVSPEAIDVAEIHDAFTISQIIHLEDLGLVPRGKGWRHALDPAPRVVVNPSGGLLSRGHPLGATGIAQFDSVCRYLTDRSIDPRRRRFGLVQEAGGLRTTGQILSECTVVAPADRASRRRR